VCHRPPGSIEQLLATRAQGNQVLKVLGTGSLVNCCIELQEHLVSTARKVHNQTAVTALNRPVRKSGG